MTKKNAFIVEDEFIISQNIKYKLEENGYNVIKIVNTGEKAIESIESLHNTIDFILMDIKLDGELDGIETATIIKQKYNIPLIFLTAYSSESFLERSKIAEPYAYILKPFSDRELIINIEIALYKHQIEKKLHETQLELKELNEHLEEKVKEQTAEILEQNKQLEKLSTVVEQAVESVIITNNEGLIEYVNPAFTKNLGYKPEEVIGKNPRMFKSGVHSNAFYKIMWDTIQSGKIFEMEIVNKTKNNEILYEEKTIAPLKDKNGLITHFVSYGKNINNQKLIEEQYQENIKLIELVFNAVPAIIFIFDLETKSIIFVNNQLKNILEYEVEEIKNMNFKELQNNVLPSINLDEVLSTMFTTYNKESKLTDGVQVKVQKASKKSCWLNLIASVFDTNENNEPTKILGIVSDVTEIRQNEKQYKVMMRLHEIMKNKEQKLRTLSLLEGQEKERKRFAMEIHDNIGQLLTATKLNAEKIDLSDESQMIKSENVKTIEVIKSLIKETISEVRKISNEITPSTLHNFGLHPTIKQNIDQLRNCGFNIVLNSNIDKLRFDQVLEQELFRIIQEALNNAVKHAKSQNIVVTINYSDALLKVSIQDDGIGFKQINTEELIVPSEGKGLISMNERAKALNAKFNVSSSPDSGCLITFEINATTL